MAKVMHDSPVPLWRLFIRMGGWFSLILFGVVPIFTAISESEHRLAVRFEAEGVWGEARVTDKYRHETTDSDGDTVITHTVELLFRTATGTRMQVSRDVSRSQYNRTEVGADIPLRYLPSEPDLFQLSADENESASSITRYFALLDGLVALVTFWFPARKAVAAVRARRYGQRETAWVTGKRRTSTKVNDEYRYRLTWREASGREGESLNHKLRDLRDFAPDDEIIVYQGIGRAWWEGDIGPRAG